MKVAQWSIKMENGKRTWDGIIEGPAAAGAPSASDASPIEPTPPLSDAVLPSFLIGNLAPSTKEFGGLW